MKIKHIISIALSAVLLGSTAATAASAQETNVKTYRYVALGDSVTAGYGLSGATTLETMGSDPALLLTDDLIADPVQEAYPALFGEYLAALGAENGVETTATNLGACAYRAEDVAKTITTEGYKSAVADTLLRVIDGSGSSSELLANYHSIFDRYLPQADLVSVLLGGNDMIMGFAVPMTGSDNPVLKAIGRAFTLKMVGCDTQTAVAAGVMMLNDRKDEITADDVKEAAAYLKAFLSDPEASAENAANQVKGVVEAVRSVNPDADIALMDLFNPFGNSLEYDGQMRDLCNVAKNIIVSLLEEIKLPFAVKVNNTTIPMKLISKTTVEINGREVTNEELAALCRKALEKLVSVVTAEISYPLQYLTAGKFADTYITLLRQKLQVIAEETDCIFVDVYNVSNENDLDPHPNAATHREMADLLYAAVADTVSEKMAGKAGPSVSAGDFNLDGSITISDVTEIQKHLAGYVQLSEKQLLSVDINGDGVININDATHLQKYLAGFFGIVLGKHPA